jgi:CHAT domain-containing protein/Tfp pilus assembly protein PilF
MRSSLSFRRCNPRLRRAARRAPLLLALLLCGAETAPPAGPLLHDGFTQEREIRGGEKHAYQVELQEGQFLRVTVQEKGIDVEIRLVNPQGTSVVGADSFSLFLHSPVETEDLAAVASTTGTHHLEVVASGKPDRGSYLLRVEGPRMPEAADRTRAEAVKALWRGAIRPVGDDDEQIHSLERAAVLWEEVGDSRKSAQILWALGRKRHRLGRYAEAVEDLQRSVALWPGEKGPQSRAWEAWTINALGRSLARANRPEEARSAYEKALSIAREIGDDSIQSSILSNRGLLASDNGELRQAIDLQSQALDLAKKVGDPRQEGEVLSNLAYAFTQASENQKAVQFYQKTLDLARSTSNRDQEALAHNQLAVLYGTLGDFEDSLSHYQAALVLNRANPNRTDEARINEARTLSNIGNVYEHLGKPAEARISYRQALTLAREVKDQETQTQILLNESSLALRRGRPTEALKLAQQALPLAQGDREREADAHFVLGQAYRALKDRPAARRELEAALTLDRRRGDLPVQADVTLTLARLDRDAGDLPAALSHVDSALEIVESLRTRVVDQELRTSFSAARQDYYELRTETLMAIHDRRPIEGFAAEALKTSEGARARTLLEVLKESEADIREGADPELIKRERQLREEVNHQEWLRERLLATEKPDPAKLDEAEQRVKKAQDEYRDVQASLRESSPRYAALTQPQPLSLAEIQQLLDGQALLLEYSLGAERSFLWLVGPHSLDSFPLKSRKEIEKAARRYYELLTARNARKPGESPPARKARIAAADVEAEQAGRDLYRMILQPAARLLKDQPLLVVADGALQYIPFAALPIPASGEPLGTRHEIVSLPSATALAALRRELRGRAPAPRELAIFANPVYNHDKRLKLLKASQGKPEPVPQSPNRGAAPVDRDSLDVSGLGPLPYSEEEAKAIAALLSADQVFMATGFEASRSRATGSELKGFRKLHFATHGILDTQRPDLSGLVLSLYDEHGNFQPDGVLRLNDIYNLRLGADLVVLSACRTALGKEWRGEGLIGLTRGFMYAGAARVVASLWNVEDRPTAELMVKFYQAMLREGLSPAAALRQAQLAMRRNSKQKSPYYWAGFSLQGEWR